MAEIVNKPDSVTDILGSLTALAAKHELWAVQSLEALSAIQKANQTDFFRGETLQILLFAAKIQPLHCAGPNIDVSRKAQETLEKDNKDSSDDFIRKILVSGVLRSVRELRLALNLWRSALTDEKGGFERKSRLLENVLTTLQYDQEKNICLFLVEIEKLEQELVSDIGNSINELLPLLLEELDDYLTGLFKYQIPKKAIHLINEFAENRLQSVFGSLLEKFQLRLYQKFTSIAEYFYDRNETRIERAFTISAQIFGLEHAQGQMINYHSLNYPTVYFFFPERPKIFPHSNSIISTISNRIPIFAKLICQIAGTRFRDLIAQMSEHLCYRLTGELAYLVGSLSGDLRQRVETVALGLRSVLERGRQEKDQYPNYQNSLLAIEEDLCQLRDWQDILDQYSVDEAMVTTA